MRRALLLLGGVAGAFAASAPAATPYIEFPRGPAAVPGTCGVSAGLARSPLACLANRHGAPGYSNLWVPMITLRITGLLRVFRTIKPR